MPVTRKSLTVEYGADEIKQILIERIRSEYDLTAADKIEVNFELRSQPSKHLMDDRPGPMEVHAVHIKITSPQT